MNATEVGFGIQKIEGLGLVFLQEIYSPYTVQSNLITLQYLSEIPVDRLGDLVDGRNITFGEWKARLVGAVYAELSYWRGWDIYGTPITIDRPNELTFDEIVCALENLNHAMRKFESRTEFDFRVFLENIEWNTLF